MKVFIVDLEAVETRYTGQWKDYIPTLLHKEKIKVEVIEGPTDIPAATTPGAFLNFGGTNVYKANQLEQISRLFTEGGVNEGDHFLFTDAWNPAIINLKYMSELLNIPVKIHALWHAGSYDPADFLGRLIGDTPWVRHAEKSFFYAIDYNYFATDFHIRMFEKNLFKVKDSQLFLPSINDSKKVIRTGWPMAYMPETLAPYTNLPKRDLILFPHRIAPEKQVDIFRELSSILPQYEFIVCQDQHLTKNEYHSLLGQAKIVFSASLQETLGIGCYEGALVGAIPMVPDRLSYSEMYHETFKYPSEWTESWESFKANQDCLADQIIAHMKNYENLVPTIQHQAKMLTNVFFSADNLVNNIKTFD